jgi:ArsR family transcriptional regulator
MATGILTVKDDLPARVRGARCCAAAGPDGLEAEQAEAIARDLQALGHPIRLRILEILARRGGEVCVCDLEGALPVKQPTISHHLRLLREAGLVETVRKGVWAYYLVQPAALAALRGRVGRMLAVLGDGKGEQP